MPIGLIAETEKHEHKKLEERIISRVKYVGKDKFGRSCWQYGTTGRRYCGKNGKTRAIAQGFAILGKITK